MTLIKEATAFAKKAHEGQVRKVRGNPYIDHPIGVAAILEEAGFSEEVVAAGLLHDVVEDTAYTLEDIQAQFGEKVAALVASNTEQKRDSSGNKRPWQDRKDDTIKKIATSTMEEKALLVADKLDNLRSLMKDAKVVEKQGKKIEDYFSTEMKKQVWYYTKIRNEVFLHLDREYEVPNFFTQYASLVKEFQTKLL